jgi:hypothetical protein
MKGFNCCEGGRQASERASKGSEQRQWITRESKIFVIYFCAKVVVLNVCVVGR